MTIQTNKQTSIEDARAEFEANATDLRAVDFSLSFGNKQTKSISKSVITPLWDKGLTISGERFTHYEVLLGGDVKNMH